MPRVDAKTVEHVARLARLSLSAEERELFARQLEDILAWAESLQALDVSEVPPMAHPLAPEWREDSPREALPRDRVLEAAPDAAEGLFRVPRVIGG
ncbi:MAG TPA: Asp-tRNA(Asn)/Glu-tRNA(Gln) amidotransferase subunit GatC [Vicinamibacteria bacterium]|nr:Asp-tRNA(Asn)/Glu-tRNA(Gln) amidotransferase subunit GatC [Vicinamibacteria bacterium]